MKKEFLFYHNLSTTATAVNMKIIADSFFEASGISWQNLKHICTNSAPVMAGIKGGFVTFVEN